LTNIDLLVISQSWELSRSRNDNKLMKRFTSQVNGLVNNDSKSLRMIKL